MLALASVLPAALDHDALAVGQPVIAVMSQPMSETPTAGPGKRAADYLPASYVKWIELAGGRVVPVSYEATDAEVDGLFEQVNGLLLIGGDAERNGASQRFFNRAVAAAKTGDTFPIWGTCDGFEWLMQMAAQDDSVLHSGFDSEDLPLKLNLTSSRPTLDSRLLADADDVWALRSPTKLSVLDALRTLPVTFNSHSMGVTPATYAATPALKQFFSVVATNMDRKGREFISVVESSDASLAIFGTQFHPEKNVFEWGQNATSGALHQHIPHSRAAVAVAQYFANFFVDQCRASTHKFVSAADQWSKLIYEDTARLSTMMSPNFVQSYMLGKPKVLEEGVEAVA